MKLDLIGPSLYMDKVGSYYEKKGDEYIPVSSKVIDAENRYVERHKKGGKQK